MHGRSGINPKFLKLMRWKSIINKSTTHINRSLLSQSFSGWHAIRYTNTKATELRRTPADCWLYPMSTCSGSTNSGLATPAPSSSVERQGFTLKRRIVWKLLIFWPCCLGFSLIRDFKHMLRDSTKAVVAIHRGFYYENYTTLNTLDLDRESKIKTQNPARMT